MVGGGEGKMYIGLWEGVQILDIAVGVEGA